MGQHLKNKEIYDYLIGNRDFDKGIAILSKYEKRKNFINIMQRKKGNAWANRKLHYTLWKHSTLPHEVLSKKQELEAFGGKPITLRVKQKEQKPKRKIDIKVDGKPKQAKPKNSNIDKIKEEMVNLTDKRSALQKQLRELGDGNDKHSVSQRAILGEGISKLSERIDILFIAKENYFQKGVEPNMEELFPTEKKPSIPELMKREKNIISSLTKDRNKLLYQSQSKQEEANPMPNGPKRDKIVQRVKEKEDELADIRKILKDAV
jgi:hypothetical protein